MTDETTTESAPDSGDFNPDDTAAIIAATEADLRADRDSFNERVEEARKEELPSATRKVATEETTEAAAADGETKAEPSLIDKVRARAAARQQPKAEEPKAEKSQDIQTLIELTKQRAAEEARAEFERDPIAWFDKRGGDAKAAYERMTKVALNRDGVEAQDRVAALEAKLAELQQAKEQEAQAAQQRQAAEQAARVRQSFVEKTSNAERYKLASALDDEFRVGLGAMIESMTGESDLDIIASDVEAFLADVVKRATAKSGSEPAEPSAQPGRPPTTITGDMAAQSAGRSEPMSEEEELEWVIRETQRELDAQAS